MPEVTHTRRFYERPHMGQTFRRQQSGTEYQDGHVVGVYVNGTYERDGATVEEWFATIQYGTQEEARINSRTELIPGAVQWLPVVDEAAARFGPGYVVLEKRLDEAYVQIAKLVQDVALALAGPAPAAPPPPVEDTQPPGDSGGPLAVEEAPIELPAVEAPAAPPVARRRR